MKRTIHFFALIFMFVLALMGGQALAQDPGVNPNIAFDATANRYLTVYERDAGSGNTEIMGRFRNSNGSVPSGDPILISVARPTQGCFYGQFDEQNGEITTPSDCGQNKNPTVAYNNGQYLIAWEVHGTAGSPSSGPDNQFVNIFAKVVDAASLNPLPGWEEGILISKTYIAANNAESVCGDKHACNDSQIQAWSQSINPQAAPRLGVGGFVVTWQTNKDFIGCADSSRRQAWAVYGRYIDQAFSATSTTNPPSFAVFKDDSTMADKCEPQSNVDNGANPRIAFNQTTNDFVISYEVARASGGNASIGAKRVTLNDSNVGQVTGSVMPDIVAAVDGASLSNGDLISYKNNYVLVVGEGSSVRAKSFASDAVSSTQPAVVDLGGGAKRNPRLSSNLGDGGQRPAGPNTDPERLIVTYEQGGAIRAALLDETLAVVRPPAPVSGGSTDNQASEVASDFHDFVAVWQGTDSGEKIFADFIDSSDTGTNNPPTAPGLLLPADPSTFAPTRAFLSWNASTDPDGDTVTYNIFFGETAIPASPQVTGVTGTDYIIGPETFADSGITLQPSRVYKWKVEADDGNGGHTSSPVRTINTDNSVVGWWRFDENPVGPVCAGGAAGETVCDSSGLNNHGVPNGGPTWLPPPMPDILGGALDFDGTNDFIEIQNTASMNPVSFSILAIIKPQGTNMFEQKVIDKRSGGFGYDLRVSGDVAPLNYQFVVKSDGVNEEYQLENAALNLNTTYHITGTYNHTTKRVSLYKDGALIGSHIIGVAFNRTTPSPDAARIGKISFTSPNPSEFNGVIDEVILLNRELPLVEVVNNYDSAQN